MERSTRYLARFSLSAFGVIALCLILIFTGTITLSIPCFAVDSTDRLYIGTENEIRVYAAGTIVDTINPRTSRGYMFTISENDNIILSTATKKYTLDLQGNVIDVEDDLGADIYNQIQYRKRKFTSASGDTYRLAWVLGRTRIVKNDVETVYQISLLSFVIKVLLAVFIVSMFVFPVWLLIQRGKMI